jgi:hypothetical protein
MTPGIHPIHRPNRPFLWDVAAHRGPPVIPALSIRRIAIAPYAKLPLTIALIRRQDDQFFRSALMTVGLREVMGKCVMVSPNAISV